MSKAKSKVLRPSPPSLTSSSYIDADEEVDEGGEGRNTLDLALLKDEAAPLSLASASLLAPPEVTVIKICIIWKESARVFKGNIFLETSFWKGGEGRNTLDLALLKDEAAPLSPASADLLAPPEVTVFKIVQFENKVGM